MPYSRRMKNIFVLGGSGFVGAHVCEQLVRAGWLVTVPTRRRVKAQAIQHLPGLTVLEMDVHDEAALIRAVAGHSAVVNLVAILHGDATAFARTHVQLAEKIARACVANGVSQLVQVSALGADPARAEAAPSNYLRSKSAAEGVLAKASAAHPALRVSVLRPSVIFGANDKFLNVFARLQALFPVMPLACADARFQPLWVEDVASAVLGSLKQGLEQAPALRVYELAGTEVYTLRQLVQFAARNSGINQGRGRPVIGLPLWMGRIQAFMLGLMPGEPVMSQDNLDSMQLDNVASGGLPGLAALGITASSLQAIGPQYLFPDAAAQGLLGLRNRRR